MKDPPQFSQPVFARLYAIKRERVGASQTLSHVPVVQVVVMCTFFLLLLLLYISYNIRDDEVEVCQAVEECAGAVGREIVDLSAVTDVLLPVLRGEVR